MRTTRSVAWWAVLGLNQGLFRVSVGSPARGCGFGAGLNPARISCLGHRGNASSLCRCVCIANLLPMTTETAYPADDPRRLLSSTRELAQRVRKAQRASWFPLLVLAAVAFASIPVYRYGGHHLICGAGPGGGPHGAPGRVCTVYSNARFVYWPVASVLAYVAIAAFYIRRSRAWGIETRVRPYAIAGIIFAVALTGAALWEAHHPLSDFNPTVLNGLPLRLASPGAAIGLALLVLAWAERSRALLLLTLAYLAVVLAPIAIRVRDIYSPWAYLPSMIHGSVLLLGGVGFALAQRPLRSPAP